MPTSFPQSTPELLALIEGEWTALMRVLDRLTPEQMTTPDRGGWSPKDNLAHLAEWMRYMQDASLHKMPRYQAMRIDAEKYNQLDEDGVNAVLLERNRNRPAAEVIATLKSTYAGLLDDLRTMPFPELMKPLRDDVPDPRRVIDSVLGNTSDHFREHRLTIEKAL